MAERHRCGIAEVATAWVLQQPQVGAAIVGARHARHLPAAVRAATLALDHDDAEAIAAAVAAQVAVPGDVYALERVAGGRHAAVMRYELQSAASG